MPEAGLALLEWLEVARARSVDAVARDLLHDATGPVGRQHPRRTLLAATDPDLLPPAARS
ncbi:hypothetical protein [Actinomycetospora straminea]|uniref:hypothetical protein n=1 Tax=Actinomycetospora straminea TaxID=663607 RepID=UPI0023664714|nr:hypothetical protein [Actinomycetospora straminea]MDD7932443.1 hypothetical protein [Actinomycetospora straminea]